MRTAAGAEGSVLPYFFLERYLPSYVHEWEAFVSAVARRHGAAGGAPWTRARRS